MLAAEPESDLWSRMHRAGTVFQAVPRLTAVKFPVARRKDCYQTRACDERRRWSERIACEPDLEAVERGRLLAMAEGRFRERLSLAGDLRAVLRRLPAGLGRRLGLGRHKPFRKGEMVDRQQALKALDRKGLAGDSPTHRMINEVHWDDMRPALVVLPIGVRHGPQNLGTTDALVLNLPTQGYDYGDPDHWRLRHDTTEIPDTGARAAGPCDRVPMDGENISGFD